jgi:hypothetical protein
VIEPSLSAAVRATTIEIIYLLQKWPANYINSKSCSLVRTICVSDYSFPSIHPLVSPTIPIRDGKKGSRERGLRISTFEIYVPEQTHIKFSLFTQATVELEPAEKKVSLACSRLEKCQNNYGERKA